MRILTLTGETKKDLLDSLLKRSPASYGKFEGQVNEIVANVKENRDQAVFEYTKRFDGAEVDKDSVLVTDTEIQEAYGEVDDKLLGVVRKSLVNIRKYHEKQLQNSWFTSEDGVILGQKVTAVDVAGV